MAQELHIFVIRVKSMKIIVPIYDQRLSPVFDWCMRAILVDVLSGKEVHREEIDLSVLSGMERVEKLVDLGAVAILCGGISMQLEGSMTIKGINVISWISGNAEEILSLFLKGELNPQSWLMPGVKRIRNELFHSEKKNGRYKYD